MSEYTSPYRAISDAVQQAQELDNAVRMQADALARLLRGRLRHVAPHLLIDLKRELQQFDSTKRKWKAPR